MKKALIGVVAALAVSWAYPVAAQTVMTGNNLLQRAASVKKVDAGSATNADFMWATYVQGFAFGTAFTLHQVDPLVCLPGGSDTGQYVRVMVQYLEANPTDLHKEATELAIHAFRRAFPCRKP